MKLDISEKKIFPDCFEGILGCIAIYLHRHYEWMYLNEWRFQFSPPPAGTKYRLGVALDLHRNKVEPLANFHGIRYRQYACKSFERIRDILEKKLSERMPITVRADAYYCHWDKSFERYHNPNHIFFLNGLHIETGCFICSDPFYQVWDQLISPDQFMKMYAGQYGEFEITEDVCFSINGVETFRGMLNFLFDEKTFEAIRRLANEVRAADFSNEAQPETDVWFSPIYRRMMEIANSRRRLTCFVTFISEQYAQPELLHTIPLLESIGEMWLQIRDLTLKLLLTNNKIFQERLAKKIGDIAETEENAAVTLLTILGE